ncbi:hypothetical protein KAR91_32570 [Candidatus Pacearchaeota archaeon]|nr:hypothetical protein [Candidatus Pacearchaeota archaeon]
MAKKKKKKIKKKSTRPVIEGGDRSQFSDGLDGNRVFVGLAKTTNIGNYESIRVEVGTGRTITEGRSHQDTLDMCLKEASSYLEDTVDIVVNKFS